MGNAQPGRAQNIIDFGEGDAEGKAARINYRVPLPGSYVGRRVIELADLVQDDQWTDAAKDVKVTPNQVGIEKVAGSNTYRIDESRAASYLTKYIESAGLRYVVASRSMNFVGASRPLMGRAVPGSEALRG